MIGPTEDICVYLHLGSPQAVAFAVHAPEGSVPLSPAWSTTATGEECGLCRRDDARQPGVPRRLSARVMPPPGQLRDDWDAIVRVAAR